MLKNCLNSKNYKTIVISENKSNNRKNNSNKSKYKLIKCIIPLMIFISFLKYYSYKDSNFNIFNNKMTIDKNMLYKVYKVKRIYNYHKKDKITTTKYKTNYNSAKLYYNGSSLGLFKCKLEIKNYKLLNISYQNKEDFIKRENPKISIIITVYNQEKYLKMIYASIQKQSLKDIEIIFVDDASTDNSSIIIKEFMKIDKRIIYVRNEENKRAFYSRNRGVLISRGEYILAIDPDDLLLNNILIKLYKTSKQYDLDILQYYVLIGSRYKNRIWRKAKYKSGILYGDLVMNVFYYSITRTIWDKLIKREVFIDSILFMKREFHMEKYVLHNDETAFLGIIKMAKSYGFLEQIGYFYNYEIPNSTHKNYFKKIYMNNILHSLFATMKYYFIQSNNNSEKILIAYNFFNRKVYRGYLNKIDYLTEGFDYIVDVINLYLECKLFTINQTNNLINFKNKVIKRISDIKNTA